MIDQVFRHRRLYQEIANHLGQRIHSGEFAAGSSLPGENTLAKDYGVSRNIIREALVALEILGLITVRAGSGAFVNEGAKQIETSLGRIGLLSGPSPLAIFKARRAIEGEVAFQAATNAEADDLATLAQLLHVAEHGPATEVLRADWPAAFHIALARATGNAVFVEIVSALWQAVRGPMFQGLRAQVPMGEIASRIGTRRRIYDCVEARDPEGARLAMHAHIDTAARELFGVAL